MTIHNMPKNPKNGLCIVHMKMGESECETLFNMVNYEGQSYLVVNDFSRAEITERGKVQSLIDRIAGLEDRINELEGERQDVVKAAWEAGRDAAAEKITEMWASTSSEHIAAILTLERG